MFASQSKYGQCDISILEKVLIQLNMICKKHHVVIRSTTPPDIIKQFEDELCLNLGTKVHILQSGKKGKIQIDYYSNDDLERLILLLKNGAES